MITLTKGQVLLLHKAIYERYGGSYGVRDEGLLDSALEAPFMTFGGQDLHPDELEKIVRFGYGLISNHPFHDGNKRIGLYVMLSFLEMNGIRIQCTDEELVHIGLSIADGEMGYEELYNWVLEHEE